MLRFTPIENARQAEHYYSVSDGGYYLNDHDLHREWGGRGAELLDLSGPPDYEQFKRLIHGLDPQTGEQLTAKLIEDRIPGWDVTASVPKGVTSALERGDGRIRDVLWRAGRKALSDIEELSTTRVRKDGRDEDRVTGNLVWYATEHPETRPAKADGMPDWDRHIHFVVFNLTHDAAEDQWKAAKFRPIMDLRKWFSTRFDMYMSHGLAELGYEIETKLRSDGKGGKRYYSWDIKGIPASVIKNFSRRSSEVEQAGKEVLEEFQKKIEEKNQKEGTSEPIPQELSVVVRDKLGAIYRQQKRDDMTLADYRDYWNSRITPEEGRQITATIERARQGKNPRPANTVEKGVSFALEHWFYRHSVLEEKFKQVTGLYISAMERCLGGALPQELDAEFKKQGVLSNRPDLPEWDARKEVTTAKTYGEEREITAFTREGNGRLRPVLPELAGVRQLLGDYLNKSAIELTDEQEGALNGLLHSSSVVNVVNAGQGTGKTTMLEQFGKALKRLKVGAIWLGTTHTAVDELKQRGLPAMTLARFLASPEEQKKAAGNRIILDEDSMLSHRDAYRLFMYAKANGCRIDLVGDTQQYKTPVAGDPIGLLLRFGGVKPITMKKTMRQQGKLKEAMEAILDGKVLKGHDMLSELGFVHEMPLEQLSQRAADLYLQWTAGGKAVPVISPTHAQADDIAGRIRAGLRARGDLKGEDKILRRLVRLDWSPAEVKEARKQDAEPGIVFEGYGAYREATQALAVGDLVKTTMGGKTKDGKHRICNGQRYRITGFTKDDDPILNNGWVVDKNWGGLVQRYVRTGQGTQGITADPRAIVVYGTPSLVATRQDGFYVPVSRVKTEVAVLTDSNAALRAAIQKQDVRKLATEMLKQNTAREQAVPRRRALVFIRRMQDYYRRLRERVAEAKRTIDRERGLDHVAFAR
jgi:conjugative relaxase-like TrwC/TraI family protein